MAVLLLSLIPPNALPFRLFPFQCLGPPLCVRVRVLEEKGVRKPRAFGASAGMKALERNEVRYFFS